MPRIPGRTERISLCSSVYWSTISGISGKGPMKLKSPLSTLKSIGHPFKLRIFTAFKANELISDSKGSRTVVEYPECERRLNRIILNNLPFFPTRVLLMNRDFLENVRTISINIGMNGNKTIIRKMAANISNALLNILQTYVFG